LGPTRLRPRRRRFLRVDDPWRCAHARIISHRWALAGAHDSRMSRRSVYAAVAVIVILGAAVTVTALRDRDAAGTPPSPSVPPSLTATAAVASPTASMTAGSPTP